MIYHYCDINDTGYRIYVNYKPDSEQPSHKIRSPGVRVKNATTGQVEFLQTRSSDSSLNRETLPDLPALLLEAPDTTGYTTLSIGAGGGEFTLDEDTDYVVSAPAEIGAPVSLVGGRNIVWIAGRIRINNQGPDAIADYTRRGLTVSDSGMVGLTDGRIIHLEGIRIDGDDLDEGIDVAVPTAYVRIANCEIYNVHFRGSDDRDGTGDYFGGGNHPNVLQTWGGFKELWVDGLNASHNYEGIRLQNDNNPDDNPVHLRRVHIRAIGHDSPEGRVYFGHTNLAWARDVDKAGKLYIDNGTVFSQHSASGGWVAADANDRVWPDGFDAFEGGFYFGRAGVAAEGDTIEDETTVYDWEATGVSGWQENNASALARDTVTKHDGVASLKVTGTYGTGFTVINPVGPSIDSGSRDFSSQGDTVAVWVYLPVDVAGSGWQGTIQVRDSSFTPHQADYVSLTPGQWTELIYNAGDLLEDVEKFGVSIARNSGTSQSQSFYIDSFRVGTLVIDTTYVTDPEPGTAVASDAFRVWPATVSSGSDGTGPYLDFSHADFKDDDDVTNARIYTMAPTTAAAIPDGHAGLLYVSPGS